MDVTGARDDIQFLRVYNDLYNAFYYDWIGRRVGFDG